MRCFKLQQHRTHWYRRVQRQHLFAAQIGNGSGKVGELSLKSGNESGRMPGSYQSPLDRRSNKFDRWFPPVKVDIGYSKIKKIQHIKYVKKEKGGARVNKDKRHLANKTYENYYYRKRL